MRNSRFTEEQIIGFIKQAEAGLPNKELCRKDGFSDATFYNWRAKHGGMDVPDARRLRELEAENGKLKKLLAEAYLDIHSPQAKRAAIATMVEQCDLSERRACWLVGLSHDSYRNPPETDVMTQEFNSKVMEIAHARRRFGYRRIHDLLRPHFPSVNHKTVYRLYSVADLAVRKP